TVPDEVFPLIQRAVDVYKDQANVRVLPVGYFKYASAFQDTPTASNPYIYRETIPSSSATLDVCCDSCAWGHNFTDAGPEFENKMAVDGFGGNASSLIGYGAPVYAFAVRGFSDGKLGCSIGPFADYVTVDFRDAAAGSDGAILTLAHELGHA